MVGVTFLTALITAGTVGAPGVFIVPLQKEFGWSTAEISSALSIRFILFGLMAPFAAALLNRYGLRNVTLSSLAGGGLRPGRLAVHDASLAADAAVGRGDRPRHRHDRAGARRHHRRALVCRAARPRGRHSHRQRRDRTTGVPAAAGEPHRTRRLADGAGADLRDARRRRPGGAAGDARSPQRSRPAAVRRRGHRAAAGAAAEHRADHGGGARRAARRREDKSVLDPVRHLLHLRRQHQRPGPGAPDPDVPRFRHPAGPGRGPARRHGHVRFRRHHRCRAGCRTATTIAGCCSGITACAGCRCCCCRSPISRSTACRCLRCSMASTGSPRCRRRCG